MPTTINKQRYLFSNSTCMVACGFAGRWRGYADSRAAGGSGHTMQNILMGMALFALVIPSRTSSSTHGHCWPACLTAR